MQEQANTIVLLNTQKLIKSVLKNCERVYSSQFDSSIQVSALDKAIFNRNLSGGIEGAPNYRPVWLAEYFGQNLEKLSERVPFVGLNRRDDQLFFLNQIRNIIRSSSYNYKHLELIFPINKSEKIEGKQKNNFQFTQSQNLHIYLGMVRPTLAAMEQREIEKTKSAQSGEVPTAQSNVQNSYHNAGENMLVKGTDGKFDQVLTYSEIKELSEQIRTLRAQGQSPAQINAFIKQSFAGVNIFVNEQGQLEIFLASNLHPGEKVRNFFSIGELNRLFNIRLGHDLRGRILQNGVGNLSYSAEPVGMQTSTTETANFNNGEVYLDESGGGNNIFFFTTDHEHSTGLVSASVSDLRSNPAANTNFQISPTHNQIPFNTSPVRIPVDTFPSIIPKKTLMQILIIARKAGKFRPLADTKLNQSRTVGPAHPPDSSVMSQYKVPRPKLQLPDNVKINLPTPATPLINTLIKQKQTVTPQTKSEINSRFRITQPLSHPPIHTTSESVQDEENIEETSDIASQTNHRTNHHAAIATAITFLATGSAVSGSLILNWLTSK